jgi:hypothetical protein
MDRQQGPKLSSNRRRVSITADDLGGVLAESEVRFCVSARLREFEMSEEVLISIIDDDALA